MESFGSFMSGDTKLWDAVRRAGLKEGLSVRIVRSRSDKLDLANEIAGGRCGSRIIVIPSFIAPVAEQGGDEGLVVTLSLRQEPQVAVCRGALKFPAGILTAANAVAYLESAGDLDGAKRSLLDSLSEPETAQAEPRFFDLRQPSESVAFMARGMKVRHFNEITPRGSILTKRSSDVEKLRDEFAVYGMLPEQMRKHYVQPFAFRQAAEEAEYSMYRFAAPDLGTQWVHGVFDSDHFEALCAQIFSYIRARPAREVGIAAATSVARDLYFLKVRKRMAALQQSLPGQRLESAFREVSQSGTLRDLLGRYEAGFTYRSMDTTRSRLVLTHGDLCFSNILYDFASREFKFIDPRGARTRDQLYSDELYDLAKLSHSVLGGYDFVVRGLADVELSPHEDRGVAAVVDQPQESLKAIFIRNLGAGGYDSDEVRLCEVSLFLSMLPLHSEDEARMLSLALTAESILEAIGL